LKEPEICPNCGKPTKEHRGIFLQKQGLSAEAIKEVLRLYEQRKEHIFYECYECGTHRKPDVEYAWICLKGVLWGWVIHGRHGFWRISESNKEKVVFT
jgi:hypothetical protein